LKLTDENYLKESFEKAAALKETSEFNSFSKLKEVKAQDVQFE